jgi:hypothetical protein
LLSALWQNNSVLADKDYTWRTLEVLISSNILIFLMFHHRDHQYANMAFAPLQVSNMLNKLHGQPESYDKKFVALIYAQRYADRPAGQNIGLVERSAQAHTVL